MNLRLLSLFSFVNPEQILTRAFLFLFPYFTGQAMDQRKSIVGIPRVFDKLVQDGGDPLTAVKTVVALLAGEPEV